jgi:FtsH-binding integral membrane protein
MFSRKLPASLLCLPLLPGSCAWIGSYTPSLDVYGSYFPAWLICLMVGVILTIFVSLIARPFNRGTMRILGFLVTISLILIFSISTWFLFFAASPPSS